MELRKVRKVFIRTIFPPPSEYDSVGISNWNCFNSLKTFLEVIRLLNTQTLCLVRFGNISIIVSLRY